MPSKLTEMPLNSKTHELVLPGSNPEENNRIVSQQSILFIGANGSGKTRLGTWIELEGKQDSRVHRISAQKSLSMPPTSRKDVTPLNLKPGGLMEQSNASLQRGDQG
jgi:type IV secretory pathway ATPase VirB11/archaellum biosynthesis ATPase